LPKYGMTFAALKPIVIVTGFGFYLPAAILWFLRSKRQEEIFLSLPDGLDLLVVCVESGLGLDAGLRKVSEELIETAPALCGEFALRNFQLQVGLQRREVLRDVCVRSGVDDLKALEAILI